MTHKAGKLSVIMHHKKLSNDHLESVLVLIVLLLILALTSNSTGITKGGDDDGGSGIGGTGRTLNLSASGMANPYLGMEPADFQNSGNVAMEVFSIHELAAPSITDLLGPGFEDLSTPLPAPVELLTFPPLAEAGVIPVTVALQYKLDTRALIYHMPLDESLQDNAAIAGYPAADQTQEAPSGSWQILKMILTTNSGNAASSINDETLQIADENDSRAPEHVRRIQRPELPPVQRIRPVERISVLPPRVKPLRI